MINNQNIGVLSEKVARLESAVSNSTSASGISYDNTESGLTADDVQGAIDEVDGKITTKSTTTSFTNAKCNTTYSISCRRSGNSVNISTIILASEAIAANEVLATIPEDYRPSDNLAYFVSQSNAVIQVLANGNLKVSDISDSISASKFYAVNINFVV